VEKKTITVQVIEALTSPEVLGKIIPNLSDKTSESITDSINSYASFVVFGVLKLLADLLDFQEFVFYWVCQVFLVYFRMVIQIVYGLLVLRRLDCLLLTTNTTNEAS
jgi:hypothetical protein